MKVFSSSLVISYLLFSATALQSLPYSSWNTEDLKQFLKDRQVAYKKDTSSKELNQLIKNEFEKIKNPSLSRSYIGQFNDLVSEKLSYGKQKVLNLAGLTYESLPLTPSSNWDYLTLNAEDKYNEVSNWVFDTWSSSSLKNLLKSSKIKYNEKDSREKLLKLAKANYNYIAKHHKSSGKYPGDWLYSRWSTEDLQNWLKKQKLSYSNYEPREKLLKKVRDHVYLASVDYEDSKKSFFDSLNLANQKIFNTLGQIKDDFVTSWSDSQIKEWLAYHDISIPEKFSENRAELEKLVESNKDSLTDDIKSWSEVASKSVSPFLSKATDFAIDSKRKADNVINETFLINVDAWSKDRLRSFLNTRDIPVPHFASKNELITLVKKHKNTPVAFDKFKTPQSSWFDNWSTENIKSWLSENKQNVDGARETLVERASEFFNKAQSNAAFTKDSIIDTYQNVKESVEEQFNNHKPKVEKAAADVADAASSGYDAAGEYASVAGEYANSAADTLGKHYKDKKPKVEKVVKDASKTLNQQYKENKPKAQKLATDVSSKASEYASSFSSGAADLYAATRNYLNSFDSWSENDLVGYLKSFGYDSQSLSSYNHNDLLSLAKQHAEYFISGGSKPKTWKESFLSSLKSYRYSADSYLVQYWPFNRVL